MWHPMRIDLCAHSKELVELNEMYPSIYVLNVGWLYKEKIFLEMLDYIDEGRCEKALHYHFIKDRALSLGAGLLLNFALAKKAPELSWPPQFFVGEDGKPFLAEPLALEFNLSHAGVYVALAIDKKPVGIDIEKVGSGDENVALRCFGDGELTQVLREGQVDQEAFCRLWALKESYVKFVGAGLTLDPLRLEISFEDPLRLRQDGVEKPCNFSLYEGLPGYKLALCTPIGRPAGITKLITEATLRATMRPFRCQKG